MQGLEICTALVLLLFSLVNLSSTNSSKHTISEAFSDRTIPEGKNWRDQAIDKLWSMKSTFMKPTSLKTIKVKNNVRIQLKNEAETITGSLKHRFTWALFLWALQDGHIRNKDTIIIEASSGNTAISEAFWAQQLNLSFVAVVEFGMSKKKLDLISKYDGKYIVAQPSETIVKKAKEAEKNISNSFFMNQFAHGQAAEDFFFSNGSSNVLHEYMMYNSNNTEPDWFVHSAGTGGTLTSVARYARRNTLKTKCALADTEYSPFFDWVINGLFNGIENDIALWKDPGISGIGFNPAIAHHLTYGETTSLLGAPVLSRALTVADLASIAAMRVLNESYGINGGPSTGTNFLAALQIAYNLSASSQREMPSDVLMLICDTADRYSDTYYNNTWVAEQFANRGGIERMNCYKEAIKTLLQATDKKIGNASPFDFLKMSCLKSSRMKRNIFNDNTIV